MKLKAAFAILASLILFVFVALSALLISTADLIGQAAGELAKAGENARVAEQLKSRLLVHNRDAFLYSLHLDPARLQSKDAQRAEVLRRVETISQLIDDKGEETIVADVKKEVAAYFDSRDFLKSSNLSPIEQYGQMSRDLGRAMAAIDKLTQVNHLQMGELVKDIRRRNEAADRAAVALLITGSLILLGLIAGITCMVAWPLAGLMSTITKYSVGETSIRAEPSGLWETRKIAATFNQMADRLEEKRRDQLNFVASIAHDLRNPLHSMSMAAAMFRRTEEKNNQALSEVIFRQVKNLDRLVGDLLDTTRIELGQLEIEFAVQDINSLIRDAVDLHRNDSSLHSFRLDLPDGPLIGSCDGGRISQVMNNLISNAIKYSPNGGTVRVNAWSEEGQIRISVADQGIGISPADLDPIFKPFHRTQATKDTIPGIGLGLSASRRIVEAHGGQLSAQSALNLGSVFSISMPAQIDRQPFETPCELSHLNSANPSRVAPSQAAPLRTACAEGPRSGCLHSQPSHRPVHHAE